MNQYLRIGVMAIPLAALLFIIHGSRYSGLGTNIISAGFAGQTIYSYDWHPKVIIYRFLHWQLDFRVEKLHHCFRLEHLLE